MLTIGTVSINPETLEAFSFDPFVEGNIVRRATVAEIAEVHLQLMQEIANVCPGLYAQWELVDRVLDRMARAAAQLETHPTTSDVVADVIAKERGS